MKHFETTLQQTTVFEGKVITVTVDTVELENGHTSKREIVHHNGGACIAALDENGNVFVVNQYRYAYGEELLELPAGKLEKGEDPFEAAKRELAEEAGVIASEFINLGTFYPTCGYCDEVIYLYGAKNLTMTQQHLDDDEFLNAETMPLHILAEKCLAGDIKDGKTVVGVMRLKHALEQGLF